MINTKFITSALLAALLSMGGYVVYLQHKSRIEHLALHLDLLRSFAAHLSLDLDDIHRKGSELTDFLDHIQDDMPNETMLAVRDRATGVPVLIAVGDHFSPAYQGHLDWLNLVPTLSDTDQEHGTTELEGTRWLWFNAKVTGSPWLISILIAEDDGAWGYADTLFQLLLALGIATMAYSGYRGAHRFIAKLRGEISQAPLDVTKLDTLTGLPNRALFSEYLNREIAGTAHTRKPFAVCLIDINHFKRFNDALGNAGGDELLRQIAHRIRRVIRGNDFAARRGGDEFGVILHDVDQSGALVAMQNIMAAVEKYFVVGKHTYLATARAGVALFPEHGANGQTLLHQADAAMQVAKREGTKTVIYQAMHESQPSTVVALSADLREAILRDKIELHYQPKLNCETNRICGAEALLRWHHPLRGAIPPMDFIEVAEQSGLIKQLTYWVIDRAFQDYRHFAEYIPEFKMAINLSVANLHNPHLVDEIASLVNKYNIWPANFIFEITESAVMVNVSQIVASLRALHFTGFEISVDDFGTGYTSFLNLKHLPIGEIKIDRSFVRNFLTVREDASIVQATIDLGRALGIAVVAEGVEDAPTLEKIRASGCHFAQGYFISKPAPLHVVTGWLRQQGLGAPPPTPRPDIADAGTKY